MNRLLIYKTIVYMLIVLCNNVKLVCLKNLAVCEINDTFYFPFLLKIQPQLIKHFFVVAVVVY